jgi:type I restriction-modification system DNA methylase subunit
MSEALRTSLKSALSAFAAQPLREASLGFFKTLGYKSDRTVVVPKSAPRAFLDLFAKSAPFDKEKALFADWVAADLLFQLTDQELSREAALFPETGVSAGQLRSYIFFAVELKDRAYPRGKLANLARQLNRLFPTPVMVLIKHRDLVSLAVINRRPNKLDQTKDVLGRVTLIRDIALATPHRGHLDILVSLATTELEHPEKKPITDFDTLHAAWEQIFNIELLNARFYRELANWYFWALPQVDFPSDLEPDSEKRRATGLIRLLTRLIFCWFLKEKELIPEKLFHSADLAKLLKGFDPESETSSTYYQAILQNLFFATLNQRMNASGKAYRVFAKDEGFLKNKATHDINNLYRYESLFADGADAALALFADVPFLNGGLFECLDRTDETTEKKRYLDGFSRNPKKRPHVPDRLFFDSGETADLTEAYGDKKRKAERVTGLIHILNRYKFTIVENTPIDQEIALDPELLGKVFENLLASYNEETKTTARKQTGSFYTPRPIVDYMVDESLKAHLTRVLVEKVAMSEPDARAGLDLLFAYTEKEHAFSASEVAVLIAAIDALKILDPACGSGAFPMGVLHKLVYILGKLDPNNKRWIETQLAKLDSPSMREELERAFAENNDDYGRKLSLIENCLYGVDIQPIAIQITKLRFFISLVADQKTSRDKAKNLNIKPLPNLETKFVAANTLIGLPEMAQMALVDPRVYEIEKDIETLYHNHFSEQRRDRKLAGQRKVKALRQELAKLLSESLMAPAKAKHIADWDAFDPQASADFFDPHWMFGSKLAGGFDIVIGNPPYGAEIPSHLRQVIAGLYSHQNNPADSYLLFIEKAHNLLRPMGLVSYIVSNTWLPSLTFQKIRRFLTSEFTWQNILVVRTKVFSAVVDTNVFLFKKEKPLPAGTLPVFFYEDDGARFAHDLRWSDIPKGGEAINVVFNPHAQALFRKMSVASKPLKHIAEVYNGVKPFEKGKGTPPQTAETMRDKPFVAEDCPRPPGRNWMPLLRGSLIHRYVTYWNNDSWIQYGPWLAAPRDPSVFEAPEKLFVRQTGDSIIATHGEGGFIARNNLHIILPKDATNLRYILGVLNSRSIGFLYAFINPEKGEALAEVKKNHVEELPIPQASSQHQEKVAKIVDAILLAKKMNTDADSSTLERELDQHIYALYGLTPEEIAIVEGTAK